MKFLKIIKNRNSIFLGIIILISFLFLTPLFYYNFYSSHDGFSTLVRLGAYVKAFKDGQIPLRWAGDINYGYGSPVFIFFYPLPGILSIPLNLIGLSLENSFKLVIGLSFILSFISFYFWINEVVEDKRIAMIGGVLYGLLPYHFLNLYVRASIGELMALSFVPLVLFFFEKIFKKKETKFIILGAISYSLLVLSHNSVSLLFSPILLTYALIRGKTKKDFICAFLILFLGILISAFFWLPALIEAKYTNAKVFIGDTYKFQFPPFQKLIFSSWSFGPFVNKNGGLSPQIGVINWVLVVFSLLFVFKKIKLTRLVKFWLFIFVISVFLTLNISTKIWEAIPLLKNLEFPWRIVGISSFAAAVLGTISLKYMNKKISVLILILVLLYSVQFLKSNPITSRPDSFYLNNPSTTYYYGEASPIWTAGDFGSYAKNKIEIIGGEGRIEMKNRKSNLHFFTLNNSTSVKILDNTTYFSGWQAKVDGNKVPIQFQDTYHRGLITFTVPKGNHLVDVAFGESPIRLISDYITLCGLLMIFFLFIFRQRVDRIIK